MSKRDQRIILFNTTVKMAEKLNTVEKTKSILKTTQLNEKYNYEFILEKYKSNIQKLYVAIKNVVNVYNKDTIDLALEMKSNGLNPLVLNLASDYMPGGGCRKGAMAQEEQLYYCSDYDLILGLHNKNKYYPLDHTKLEFILSTGITVLRRGNYTWLDNPVRFDFLALPGLRKPELVNNKYSPADLHTMKKKIESIFLLGAVEGYRSLLLGALGCGAYENPPDEVVAIYKEMLGKYRQHFDVINFAVLSVGSNNPNFTKFATLK
jgi:uncharacterized protein (TIGR02452 family)